MLQDLNGVILEHYEDRFNCKCILNEIQFEAYFSRKSGKYIG